SDLGAVCCGSDTVAAAAMLPDSNNKSARHPDFVIVFPLEPCTPCDCCASWCLDLRLYRRRRRDCRRFAREGEVGAFRFECAIVTTPPPNRGCAGAFVADAVRATLVKTSAWRNGR